MKVKYKWGNVKRLISEYDKCNKHSQYTAQKIRDYFDTPEWYKIKKKNGFI